MQSSVLAAYLTYITASALASEPTTTDFNCSSSATSSTFGTVLFYIGFIMTFVALAMNAFASGSLTDPKLNQVPPDPDVRCSSSPGWLPMRSRKAHWPLGCDRAALWGAPVASTSTRTRRTASGTATGSSIYRS